VQTYNAISQPYTVTDKDTFNFTKLRLIHSVYPWHLEVCHLINTLRQSVH